MISLNEVAVQFGSIYLFKDASFNIIHRDRIGLVGKNGAGKSTLLKIIANIQTPSEGVVSVNKGISLGYLPQEMHHNTGTTILGEACQAFKEIKNLDKLLFELTEEINNRTDYESDEYLDLIEQMTLINERLLIAGSSTIEAEAEKILMGLGFDRNEFQNSFDTLSGGWKMRVELAKILLQRPDVILLDEPTNHLDIESIQWLEDFLKRYHGAVVLVSHDRAFLDAVTNRTIEISLGKLYDYKANYSKYVELRAMRREQQLSAFKNQQKQIEETEKFIERFRYKATKSNQVQSRIKQLEKIERIEIDEEDTATIKFRFNTAPPSGRVVIEARNISKSYGNKKVLNNLEFVIERNDKVAFVGKNGEGKTTLSKILAGLIDYEGEIKVGYNVKLGYYAQNQTDTLDVKKTVLQTIDDVARGEIRTKIRDILGAFLFSGESVEKKVEVLSGGEKARLALAKLLLEPYNLLILDEPTNHLDMRSKDILKEALNKFEGTLIIVSHDRDFLNGLTNKLFEFKNGQIKSFVGGIYEFLESRKLKSLNELNAEKSETITNQKTTDTTADNFIKKNFQDAKEIKRINNQIKKIEEQISLLEAELKIIEQKINEGTTTFKNQDIYELYNQTKNEVDKKMEEWEQLVESLK